MAVFAAKVNVPDYPPREKHKVIFNTFEGLGSGEVMEITNDHDPKPLYYQFQIEKEGKFSWEYIEEGPEIWKVAIGKL